MIVVIWVAILLFGISGAVWETEIIHKRGVIFEEIGEINFGDSFWTIATSIDLALTAPLIKKLVQFHDWQLDQAENFARSPIERYQKSAKLLQDPLTTMADQLDAIIDGLKSISMGGSNLSIKRPNRRIGNSFLL